MGVGKLYDLVDQEKRVAVRQPFFDLCDVENGFFIGIVVWFTAQPALFLVVFFEDFSELHIGLVSRFCGNDLPFNAVAEQRYVTDDIQ